MTRQGKLGLVVTHAAVCLQLLPTMHQVLHRQLQIHIHSRSWLLAVAISSSRTCVAVPTPFQRQQFGQSAPCPCLVPNTWIQLNSHRHAGIQQQGELLTKYFIPFLFKQTVNNFSTNRLSLVNKKQSCFFFFHYPPGSPTNAQSYEKVF